MLGWVSNYFDQLKLVLVYVNVLGFAGVHEETGS